VRAGPRRSRQTRLAALSGAPAAAGALSSSSRLVAARRGIPAVPLCPVVSSRVWIHPMTTSNRLRMATTPLVTPERSSRCRATKTLSGRSTPSTKETSSRSSGQRSADGGGEVGADAVVVAQPHGVGAGTAGRDSAVTKGPAGTRRLPENHVPDYAGFSFAFKER
jgi:hypothetical protein